MDLLQKHLDSEGEDKCPKEMEMEPCLHRSQKSADALKELSSLISEKRAGLGRWLMSLASTQGMCRHRKNSQAPWRSLDL